MTTRTLICPMSTERVDKTVVRITALLTASVLAASVILAVVAEEVLLAIVLGVATDYAVRVLTPLKYSPIGWTAARMAAGLGLTPQPMDKAPKIFAVRVGWIMAVIAVGLFFGSPWAAAGVALALMAFNLLDGVLGFCVGCYFYTYVMLPAFGES